MTGWAHISSLKDKEWHSMGVNAFLTEWAARLPQTAVRKVESHLISRVVRIRLLQLGRSDFARVRTSDDNKQFATSYRSSTAGINL